MITEEEARTLIDIAIRHGVRRKVDGIEACITACNIATSRFANNGMTQNQAPDDAAISVRIQKNGKQTRLTGDQVSPAGIRAVVDNAIMTLEFLHADPEILALPSPEKRSAQKNVQRYDARTASFSAAQRAQAIKQMVDVAVASELISAGVFATGIRIEAIGNSQGLFRIHRETSAEVSITMRHLDAQSGAESTGWAKQQSVRVSDIDAAALANSAAEKALASASPMTLQPGKYTVILEPSAVLDLLAFMDYDFTATSFLDKQSCFLDKLDSKVLGQNIQLLDDVFHPLQAGAPFDGEGLQRQTVHIVDNGVVKNLVCGRKSAQRLEMKATGHGATQPSVMGEWPSNIVIRGGESSLAQMIRSTERGILLTRVWYVREVDPTTKIVTGMTRDGTFLVEEGAIKCGIKNMRFNQSLLDLLNQVTDMSKEARTAGEEGQPAVVPAMKVENFVFSSVTTF